MGVVTEVKGSAENRQKLFSSAGNLAIRQSYKNSGFVTCVQGTDIVRKYSNGQIETVGTVREDVKVSCRSFVIQ